MRWSTDFAESSYDEHPKEEIDIVERFLLACCEEIEVLLSLDEAELFL